PIFIYAGYAGGAGSVEAGFRARMRLLEATFEAVRQCPCSKGCPSCVQSPKCGNGNEPLDKQGAVALVAAMLDRTWGEAQVTGPRMYIAVCGPDPAPESIAAQCESVGTAIAEGGGGPGWGGVAGRPEGARGGGRR